MMNSFFNNKFRFIQTFRSSFLLLLFVFSGLVLAAQPMTPSDSLRLQQLKSNQTQKENTPVDRNVTLQRLLLNQSPEEQKVSIDSVTQKKLEISKMKDEVDSLRLTMDSLQKTIPDTVDSTKILKPFGYEIFNLKDRAAFEANPIGPVPLDYVLGPGDEILVSIWGDRELNYSLIVDRAGKILIPDLGLLSVNGETLGEFKELLIKKLSKIYSSLRRGEKNATTFIDISLGKLRTVRIYIFGEVRQPGGYNLAGNPNVWNALFLAGGPNKKGSLRDLRVIRNGKVEKNIDGYGYLTGKKTFTDDRLENNDVLFVPAKQKIVFVKGEIQKPAIYEILENESVGNLIETAGGFTNKGYPNRVQIERWEEYERKKVIDIAFDTEAGKKFSLQSGDTLFAFPYDGDTKDYFTINGEVTRPGRYQWEQNLSLSKAIEMAGGLTPEVYLGRVDIVHMKDDSTRNLSTFNLRDVTSGKKDTLLQNRDEIAIYSIRIFQSIEKVSVWGEVKNPGYYDLVKGMTVEDLIFTAGGFTEKSYKEAAEISRIFNSKKEINQNTLNTEIVSVKLSEDFEFRGTKQMPLQDYDMVFIRPNPNWQIQKNVTLLGEVRFPGTYSLRSSKEKIASVVERAGGLKETAYLDGAILKRTKDNVGRIAIDLNKIILKKKKNMDIEMVDGDTLTIPIIPKTVKVMGEVGLPTSILYKSGAGVSYYIDNAGGLRETADAKRITVILASGRVFQHSGWSDPDIIAGSTIVVEKKPEKIPGRTLEIISQSVTLLTGIVTLLVLSSALVNK